MAESDGAQNQVKKPAALQRRRRRLYESLSAEEEQTITQVIEENKLGSAPIADRQPANQCEIPEPTVPPQSAPTALQNERHAWDIIGDYIYKVGANAVIPIPIIDLAAVLFKQTEMLRHLAEAYDVDYDEFLAMDIIRKVWRAYNGFTLGAGVFGSAAKAIPFFGSFAGMGPVSFSAAASTYTLGKLVVEENR